MVNVLLSYPRSGNSWVRYFFEVVTGLPSSIGTIEHITSNAVKEDAIVHKTSAPAFLLKRHAFNNGWDSWNEEGDNLIVLIRDYKEAIIRNGYIECLNPSYREREVKKYMHVLGSYHNWGGRKIKIYYEDLMINPPVEFGKLAEFMSLDMAAVNEFLTNIKGHAQKSIQLYTPKSMTFGYATKLKAHANNKKVVARKIENLMQKQSPHLLEIVKRYK